MGIIVEYNPDLALRDIEEFKKGARLEDECVPEKLIVGVRYPFRKKGQRLYWLLGELPLIKTDGQKLSLPIASIIIQSVEHTLLDNDVWTTGTYEVKEVYADETPHFNGFAKI